MIFFIVKLLMSKMWTRPTHAQKFNFCEKLNFSVVV